MAKLKVRVQALAAFALCGVVAAACGNKDDDTSGDGDGDGDGGPGTGGVVTGAGGTTGTGGAVGTGGSAPTSACDGLGVVGGTDPLIDDFEHPDTANIPAVDNRVGSWFVANDMTAGAEQTPADALPTADVGHTDAGFASTAMGYETWGALFGVSLNDKGGNACAYDSSAFTGISFWAKTGDDTTQTIRVGVPILAVIPATRGGTCSGEGCDDTHFTAVEVTADWQLITVEWDDLAQTSGWAHDNKYPFDPSNVAQVTFGVDATTMNYNIIIDDLMFTGGGNGDGGVGGAD